MILALETMEQWKNAFQELNKHCVAVENARNDLMGVNEELREKIKALERGQEDLKDQRKEAVGCALIAINTLSEIDLCHGCLEVNTPLIRKLTDKANEFAARRIRTDP